MEHQFLVGYADALILSLLYIGAAIILFWLFTFLFRNSFKAALATFVAFFIFFFFGAFHDFLKQFAPVFFTRYVFLIPFLLVVYIFVLFAIKKKKPGKRIASYLNILLVILIVIDLVTVVLKVANDKRENFIINETKGLTKPNVYLILLDEYAGTQQLQDIFNFSNEYFADSLSTMGFTIAKGSASNYSTTPFSMASLLSMSYHPELKNFKYTDENLNYCYQKIAKSKVVSGFKSLGYQFVNYSIFDFEKEPSVIDKTFLKSGIELITAQTLWSRAKRDLYDNFIVNHMQTSSLYDDYVMKDFRNNELLYKRTIEEANRRSAQPKFIYTHLLMPHFPYYFNAEGQLNDKKVLVGDENMYNKELYLGYLKYVNKRVLHLVTEIIHSDPEAIILLLSDHGYRYDEKLIFSNISAIYDSKRIVNTYGSSITNVNVFRVLFNDLFKANLTLLADKHFN